MNREFRNILVLHNRYQQPGGEDVVVANEIAMLERAGFNVSTRIVDNSEISNSLDKISTFLGVSYNRKRKEWVDRLVDDLKPDLVHIHNFFPRLTMAVHHGLKERGVPVVQTLHNYRLGCAAATFERNGVVCERCLVSGRQHAIFNRCYRGSIAGSVALVAMQRQAFRNEFLSNCVDAFVALTNFARDKYIELGLPEDKIFVKPNFLDRPKAPEMGQPRHGALFVGRLSKEKGVVDLIEAWRRLPNVHLSVVGSGPLESVLRERAPSNVAFLGQVDRSEVERKMRESSVLIIPSVWYEGFPVTLVEAFSNGLPAIATRIGSLAEIVVEGKSGLLCEPNSPDSLVLAVEKFFESTLDQGSMHLEARRQFETLYTDRVNLEQLLGIYDAACINAKLHRVAGGALNGGLC